MKNIIMQMIMGRVKQKTSAYDEYCRKNGFKRKPDRLTVQGYRSRAENQLDKLKENGIMCLRIQRFKDDLSNGKINTSVDESNQQKHIIGKGWKNQVRQAILSGRGVPRSRLAKGIDPQVLIDKYAGTGNDYKFIKNHKYPDEFITLPFIVGRTYSRKTHRYEHTHRVQIKYNEKKALMYSQLKKRMMAYDWHRTMG